MFTVPGRRDDDGQPVRVFPKGCTAGEFEKWLLPLLMPGGDAADVEPEPILMVAGGGI